MQTPKMTEEKSGMSIAHNSVMKTVKELIFLLLCLLISPAALAFTATTNDLVNNSDIKTLIQQKVSIVGGISLRSLRQDFQTVQILPLPNDVPIGSCGKRLGMLNLPEKRTIYVPTIKIYDSLSKRVQNTWLLHEGLGALAKFDENYGLSVGIAWLASIPNQQRQMFLNSKVMDRIADPYQEVAPCSAKLQQFAGGRPGSTGVGGGGDPFAVLIKLELMEKAWNIASNFPPDIAIDLMERILKLPLEAADFNPFETDPKKLQELVQKMLIQPVEYDRTLSGSLIARFPVLALSQFDGFRERVVSDIFANLMIELQNGMTKKTRP